MLAGDADRAPLTAALTGEHGVVPLLHGVHEQGTPRGCPSKLRTLWTASRRSKSCRRNKNEEIAAHRNKLQRCVGNPVVVGFEEALVEDESGTDGGSSIRCVWANRNTAAGQLHNMAVLMCSPSRRREATLTEGSGLKLSVEATRYMTGGNKSPGAVVCYSMQGLHFDMYRGGIGNRLQSCRSCRDYNSLVRGTRVVLVRWKGFQTPHNGQRTLPCPRMTLLSSSHDSCKPTSSSHRVRRPSVAPLTIQKEKVSALSRNRPTPHDMRRRYRGRTVMSYRPLTPERRPAQTSHSAGLDVRQTPAERRTTQCRRQERRIIAYKRRSPQRATGPESR